MSDEPQHILYDTPAEHIARITLNRTAQANSQDTRFLYQLNEAFDRAAHDDDVRVIVLAANGKHFSAGHDLLEQDRAGNMAKYRTVFPVCGFGCEGAASQMAREEEIYIGFSERWRNIPKPTIAAVQGKVIAGGLMLIWPCDIIIAADDALFSDPTINLGICGHEYFTHVWELGARKAKEILFTADEWTAAQAEAWGMVNKVVPREQLMEATLEMAVRIAKKPPFAVKLAKKAVNGSLDAQGREIAMQNAFHLHQLAHTHNLKLYDTIIDLNGIPEAVRKNLKPGGV
ncbi:MAG TPA: enoyl-CoA hydratase [Nevskiaceae bacterium]|nr:enoyl-CoA hydratase [Nevskiaceae bacterium]